MATGAADTHPAGVAQADAAAAAVAGVEHALQFGVELRLLPEAGLGPAQRVAGRCLHAALAGAGCGDWRIDRRLLGHAWFSDTKPRYEAAGLPATARTAVC